MIDQTKMNQFKEHGAAAALELRGEIATALKDRINETMQAINVYFSDRKKRETAIADRIEALKDQKTELEELVADYAPRLAEATISDNSAALGVIQTELESLESKKAAISAQIGLLSGVSVAGDEALFNEADEKARALAAFWTATQADLSALSAFASEQMNAWSQVARVSRLGGDILPRNAVFSRVEEMRRDFTEKEGANNE